MRYDQHEVTDQSRPRKAPRYTKRHYVDIARVIRDLFDSYERAGDDDLAFAMRDVASDFGKLFMADNVNFDRNRFIEAAVGRS